MKDYQKTNTRRNNQIVKLRENGLTLQAIGDKYGLTKWGVKKIIQKTLKKLSTSGVVDNN